MENGIGMVKAAQLNAAIQEIANHRNIMLEQLGLDPDVFDSWLSAAKTGIGKPEGQLSLVILATWIRDFPELETARKIISCACSPRGT